MGEFAHDMAAILPPKRQLPPPLLSAHGHKARRRSCRDCGDKWLGPVRKYAADRRPAGVVWIIPQHIAFADIGFPGFEHRAQIDINDIVGRDGPEWRLSPAMVMPLAPARTMRRCQCFSTPNSRSASSPISSSTCRSLTPARSGRRARWLRQFQRFGLGAFQFGAAVSSTGAKRRSWL